MGLRFADSKILAKKALMAAGVSTPRGEVVASATEALAFARRLGRPIVVKPLFGTKGKSVAVDLRSDEEITDAFAEAKKSGAVLVEEFISPAAEYRVLASEDECFSVVRRIPPHVRGDGVSTIRELIARKNLHRQTVPCTVGTYIPVGKGVQRFLSRAGASLESVPPVGQVIGVSDVGGVSGGAEPQECFGQADASIKSIAVEAVKAVPGLRWCGADVIVDEDGAPCVIEVNSSADISSSTFPFFGEPRDLGSVVWERLDRAATESSLFPQPAPMGLDDVAAAPARLGTRKRRALYRLLFDYLEEKGWEVTRWAESVVRAEKRDFEPLWFSRTGTENDPSIAKLVASNHLLVMRLAHAQKLPHAAYELAGSPETLRSALERKGEESVLTTATSPWRRGQHDAGALLEAWERGARSHGVVVQARPVGVRLRVAATEAATLLVLSEDKDISASELRASCALAERVVGMVPQLNWAFVDLVIPRGSTQGSVLFEGIDVAPSLQASDVILAGSFENLFDHIVSLAQVR